LLHWFDEAGGVGYLKYKLIRALKQTIETAGYRVTRKQAINGPRVDLLNVLVPHVLQHRRGGILQIGANDGLLQDPVQGLIRRHAISAILVEPMPDTFQRLLENYAGVAHVRFMNVGVSVQRGNLKMYRIKPDTAGLPDWVHGLATLDRDLLLRQKNAPGVDADLFRESVEAVTVPVYTVADILAENHDFGPIMMLQVDTEGHDLMVVRSALDAGLLPPIIRYEHKLLPYGEQVSCREMLAAKGYTFMADDADTVCFRPQSLDEKWLH
jgi:FkbM family methyltransferase